MPFPFALAAMAAMAAAQAAAAKKKEDAAREQDALTQASQQRNSGYTKTAPVLAKLGAPSSWTDAAVKAGGTTWAQAQAMQDAKSREEMSKLYAGYLKSNTPQNYGKMPMQEQEQLLEPSPWQSAGMMA